MSESNETRRHWLQFSVKTSFVIVTGAAALFWENWIGWPWWEMDRERMQFEQRLRQIKAGMTPDEALRIVGETDITTAYAANTQGNQTAIRGYFRKNEAYCIYFELPQTDGIMGQSCSNSVRIFRLPPVPSRYQLRHSPGKQWIGDYLRDFGRIASWERKVEPGFDN